MRGIARNKKRRRGTELLEVALMLPVLIGLTFGTIEVGWYFYVEHALQGAAREGVRAAVPYGTGTEAQVQTAVARVMNPMKYNAGSDYTVTTIPADVATAAEGTPITVTVTCQWNRVGMNIIGMIKPKTLSGQAVMIKE